MRTRTDKINKIALNQAVTLQKINMATLLFVDGKAVSKKEYKVSDNQISLTKEALDFVELYQSIGEAKYFEYRANLSTPGVILYGKDMFNQELDTLLKNQIMVFVDGYKLQPSQYQIIDDSHLKILNIFVSEDNLSHVLIFSSKAISNFGRLTDNPTWDSEMHTVELAEGSYLEALFFINGEFIPKSRISYDKNKIKLNVAINPDVDIVEYYRFPRKSSNLLFAASKGILTYGPEDMYSNIVPDVYDYQATFSNSIARLAIDDLRQGFFICEEKGDGCFVITDTDYETHTVKGLLIKPFSKTIYESNETYVQVPDVHSICNYLPEFDLSGKFLPEILSSFQKTLLNEVYDSIQRLRNIRNITKVGSDNINALINFLGLKLNIVNMSLEQKHSLLEELNNFYKIVGTLRSYNFYNVFSKAMHIMNVEQLFTPIKDMEDDMEPIRRYVTFKRATDLGAVKKREYRYNIQDYGEVGTLANVEDSLTNTPNFAGLLEYPDRPHLVNDFRTVVEVNDLGETVIKKIPVTPNKFKLPSQMGPNLPTKDWGFVSDSDPKDFYDYGLVSEKIKGKWIEWLEWNRPKNWYPTNHVNVSVQIPPDVDYTAFMREFKNTFYDISSTVLYIHQIIDVYVFGANKLWDAGQKPTFGLMTSPTVHVIKMVCCNNPAIQAPIKF